MKQPILTNVCLTSIVKDELINPAGGIEDFVHCSVPFVGKAIIIDTGSTDGTLEKLNELTKQYEHLTVIQRDFTGFANDKNYLLKLSSNYGYDWSLFLDADERLTPKDFEDINISRNKLRNTTFYAINLQYLNLTPTGEINVRTIPQKIVDNYGAFFDSVKAFSGEELKLREGCEEEIFLPNYVKHFLQNTNALALKNKWYQLMQSQNYQEANKLYTENVWKKLNPRRIGFDGLRELTQKELDILK
jgi:glycosyltransferase involved in cell wall biosynthesis